MEIFSCHRNLDAKSMNFNENTTKEQENRRKGKKNHHFLVYLASSFFSSVLLHPRCLGWPFFSSATSSFTPWFPPPPYRPASCHSPSIEHRWRHQSRDRYLAEYSMTWQQRRSAFVPSLPCWQQMTLLDQLIDSYCYQDHLNSSIPFISNMQIRIPGIRPIGGMQ